MLSDQRVDGVLVLGAFLEETISQIGRQSGAIVVLVDGYSTEQRFDSIVTDNLNGAYMAVKYLIENGHRHIGLVGSSPDAYPSIRERRKGYTRALKHFEINESYIEDSPLLRDEVYDTTRRLLNRAPQITALFACNDNVAIGAMAAAAEMGRRIPDDLSIIGFDNIDLTQEVTPPLTTVHVDKILMGVLAVRRLRERAEYSDQVVMTTTLSTQLVIRGSVKTLAT
jgi:LacI family transcriptional regulator